MGGRAGLWSSRELEAGGILNRGWIQGEMEGRSYEERGAGRVVR